MTREDILRMAREAGAHWQYERSHPVPCVFPTDEHLERFAALVAAAERNKLAQWMIQHSYATGHGDTMEDLLKELEEEK